MFSNSIFSTLYISALYNCYVLSKIINDKEYKMSADVKHSFKDYFYLLKGNKFKLEEIIRGSKAQRKIEC